MNSAPATTGTTSARPRSATENRGRLPGVALVIGSLMLVALVIRANGLGATNIWLDEANSWRVARLPWGAMLDDLRASPLGPLYFVLLKPWMQLFGDSEVALRAPSLIASILVIPVTYIIGARVFSHRAAGFGTLLLTLSPLQLYFAQEARMYMLLTLLAALYVLAYLRWRDATFAPGDSEPRPAPHSLTWYALTGTALLYTNIIAATLVATINIDALLLLAQRYRRDRPGGRRAALAWAAANGAIAGALLLYLATVRFDLAGATQGWRGQLGVVDALRNFFQYPLAAVHGIYYYTHEFVPAATELWRSPGTGSLQRRFLELLVVQPLTLLSLVAILAAAARWAFTGARRAVVLAIALPLSVGTVISIWQRLDLARYFLFASPFLFLLIGDGLTRLERTPRRLSLAVLLLTMGFGIARYGRVDARNSDYRLPARVLAHESSTVSAILVQPPEALEPLSYYLRDERTPPVRTIPAGSRVADALPSTPGARVWLVLDYRSSLYEAPPDALRDSVGAHVMSDAYQAWAGGGARLVLLETRTNNEAGTARGR